jgi:hypothetical protein
MTFWHGTVCVFRAIFLVLPSIKLLQAISWPVLQADDIKCVRASSMILITCALINAGRGIWDVTAYFDGNMLMDRIDDLIASAPDSADLPSSVRAFYFVFEFIANAIYTTLLIMGVLVLRQHEKAFGDDPFYKDNDVVFANGRGKQRK